MSKASHRTRSAAPDRGERWRSRAGVVLTVLLHALLVLLVMLAPPITVKPPEEGGAAGSRMQVTYIDDSLAPPPPVPTPSPRVAPPRKPAKKAPAAKRLQTTLVRQAETSDATEQADASDTPTPPVEPAQPSDEPAASPSAASEAPTPRPQWGQPPGMLPQESAPVNAGMAMSPGVDRGPRNNASSGTSMEVGGYQVYYDLVSETRLRAWRDQGMTEVFLPLPGTRRLMVCPLEIALHRDSGKCRMIEPDSPERKAIGDARDVLNMQKVYKLGEELWSGPGAYR